MSRRSPFLLSRRALERLEREIRSSAAHRSGIGTWRFARVGWHWLPRRQRACPSAALDERVLAAIKVDRLPGRPSKHPRSARERPEVPDSGPCTPPARSSPTTTSIPPGSPPGRRRTGSPPRSASPPATRPPPSAGSSRAPAAGDRVAWVAGDISAFGPGFVTGLLGPLLTAPSVQFVKGFYRRPGGGRAGGGGRVTELVARPLIARLFPHLNGIVQPLAGEFAGRRPVLEALPIVCGWGVDLALVVDVVARHGLPALAQVDLGTRRHRHRPLHELSPQAMAILTTALRRAGGPAREAAPPGRLDPQRPGPQGPV